MVGYEEMGMWLRKLTEAECDIWNVFALSVIE